MILLLEIAVSIIVLGGAVGAAIGLGYLAFAYIANKAEKWMDR